MKILSDVRDLNLPDCFVGAGAIRNTVFDVLHHYKTRTKLNDVDVAYYDIKRHDDKLLSKVLTEKNPNYCFEVVNQAYVHEFNDRLPAKSTSDALSYWVENVTCIGVRLEKDNSITITDPNNNALESIFNLTVKPALKDANNLSRYKKRMKEKSWQNKWPKLTIE